MKDLYNLIRDMPEFCLVLAAVIALTCIICTIVVVTP